MEIELRPPGPLTEAEREAAAERLADAAGAGRLPLQEFSDRVGLVWGADDRAEVVRATDGAAEPPKRRWLHGEK